MTIAKHPGKRNKMSYDAKDYPHEAWKNDLAFKAFRSHPKFADLPIIEIGNEKNGVEN